jgi:hypothetical protein
MLVKAVKLSAKPLHADVLAEACHHGFIEGPPTKLFGERPPEKSCFGRGDVGEVTEDDGKAPHGKVLEKVMPM